MSQKGKGIYHYLHIVMVVAKKSFYYNIFREEIPDIVIASSKEIMIIALIFLKGLKGTKKTQRKLIQFHSGSIKSFCIIINICFLNSLKSFVSFNFSFI